MIRRRVTWITAVVVALAAAAVFLPAAADWLVTKGGDRIETDGPWQVKSRLVVFKRPDGTYASMRLSDVDLQASDKLTKEMAEKAKHPQADQKSQPAPERRKPIARLTEKDLPPVGAGKENPADAPKTTEPKPAGRPQQSASGLMVSSWREVTEVDSPGLAFTGQVRNPTENMSVGVTVTVKLLDEDGKTLATTGAVLSSDALPPGQSSAFRASFPGVYDYASAVFDVEGTMLRSNTGNGANEAEPTEEAPPSEGR